MVLSGDYVIASEKAKFISAYTASGLTPDGSSTYFLAKHVGLLRAKELMLTNRLLTAQEAMEWGLVNKVVPYEELEAEGVQWAKEILQHSPLSIRCLKASFNADVDGQQGLQELAGNATLLYYLTEEGEEGRKAWNEKRAPDYKKYPWLP